MDILGEVGNRGGRTARILWVLAAALCCTGPVNADISGPFAVEATNAAGTGTLVVELSEGVWLGQTWSWSLPAPMEIIAGDGITLVAVLLNASVFIDVENMDIQVGLGVLSGPSDTEFNVTAPLLSFPIIPFTAAQGRASATIDLTETEGIGGTAWITGLPLGSGTGIFLAEYESGTKRFTDLVGYIAADNGGTASATQNDPLFGYRPFYDDVSDLQVRLAFKISHDDVAFATTVCGATSDQLYEAGDLNCDGVLDGFDIDHFAQVIADWDAYVADHDGDPYPRCDAWLADVNSDGVVNGFDIDTFVKAVIG